MSSSPLRRHSRKESMWRPSRFKPSVRKVKEATNRVVVASLFGLTEAGRWARTVAFIGEHVNIRHASYHDEDGGCTFSITSRGGGRITRCLESAIEHGAVDSDFVDILGALRGLGFMVTPYCTCEKSVFLKLGFAVGARSDWGRADSAACALFETPDTSHLPNAGGPSVGGNEPPSGAHEREFWWGCLRGALERRWWWAAVGGVGYALGRGRDVSESENELFVRGACARLRRLRKEIHTIRLLIHVYEDLGVTVSRATMCTTTHALASLVSPPDDANASPP